MPITSGRLLTSHKPDKTNALARHRADQALLFAAITDGLTHSRDAAGQGRLRHNAPAPDTIDEIVLAHHTIAILHEENQEIEHLRFDRDQYFPASQLSPIHVKHMILEKKLHLNTPRRSANGFLSDIQRFGSDKSRFPQALFRCRPASCPDRSR